MFSHPKAWVTAIGLVGFVVAVVWLGAPLLPALVGAVAASLFMYYRRPRA